MTTTAKVMRRVLITGASEGIGRTFALRLAERGYEATCVARNSERLDSLLSELSGIGHRKLIADLSSPEGVSAVVKELTAGNRYQLLVNNAGFGNIGVFSEIPYVNHSSLIALNISALVQLSHAFLTRAERGDGIIQISSTLSFLPMPIQAVYSATKAFVTSFSESLWFQNRKKGVRILNVCPGSTLSEFSVRSGGDRKNIPAALTETADQVVRAALQAYECGAGPTFVSGWKNRFFVFLARFLTRKTLVEIMGTIRQ